MPKHTDYRTPKFTEEQIDAIVYCAIEDAVQYWAAMGLKSKWINKILLDKVVPMIW